MNRQSGCVPLGHGIPAPDQRRRRPDRGRCPGRRPVDDEDRDRRRGGDPELLRRLEALAAQRGETFNITSGLRTVAEQQRLWDNRHSNPYPVARPGTSNHHDGKAADVTIGGRAIQDVISASELRAAGLYGLPGDAVHVELPG